MFGASLTTLSAWLAATSLSNLIQTTGWVIPTLQTVHILCVAVLFSSAVLVDLRMLRLLQRDVPLPEVAARFLPVIWPVLVVLLLTGSLLIIGEPRRSLVNATFYLKMGLLLLAILVTFALQLPLRRTPGFWDRDIGRRLAGQCAAVASILVWCGVIFAGRWIAYTQAG
jgi:hypothetical protein